MKKERIFLALLMSCMLILTACGKQEIGEQDNSETDATVVMEENTNQVEATEEENQIPDDYVAAIIVTINPQIKLYVDANNVVVGVECLNEDAKGIFSGVELTNITVEQGIEKIVTIAVENDFLVDGKDINIEISEVRDESVDSEQLCNQVEEAVVVAVEQNNVEANITAKVISTNNSEENAETQDEIVESGTEPGNSAEENESVDKVETEPVQTTCPDCNGLGSTCSECGGDGIANCKACNQTGYETCKVCGGSAVINCHGCGGSGKDATDGETCRHCGGSGRITCDAFY